MILTLFVLAGIPLAVALIHIYWRIYRIPDRTLIDVVPYLRVVNLDAVRDLMDSTDEYYLRLNLSETQFRKAQHRRMALLLEQLGRMSYNSGILLEWARHDRQKSYESDEKPWEESSEDLVKACVHFRMGAFSIQLVVHLWMIRSALWPWRRMANISSLRQFDTFDLFTAYESLRVAAENLSRAYGEPLHQKLVEVL